MSIKTIRIPYVRQNVYRSPQIIKYTSTRNRAIFETLRNLFEHNKDNTLYQQRYIAEWLSCVEPLNERYNVEEGIASFLLEHDLASLYLLFFEKDFLAEWFEKRVQHELDCYPFVQNIYFDIPPRNAFSVFAALVKKLDNRDDDLKIQILQGLATKKEYRLIHTVLHQANLTIEQRKHVWACFSLQWIGAEGSMLRQVMVENGFDHSLLCLLRLDALWNDKQTDYSTYIKYPYSVWALQSVSRSFLTTVALTTPSHARDDDLVLAVEILSHFMNVSNPPFSLSPTERVLNSPNAHVIRSLTQIQSQDTFDQFAMTVFTGTCLEQEDDNFCIDDLV